MSTAAMSGTANSKYRPSGNVALNQDSESEPIASITANIDASTT